MLEKIHQEINSFKRLPIEILPSYNFNQYEMIKTLNLYYYSQFESGNKDSQDDYKYFKNIVKAAAENCAKAIDFDTKDIKALTAPGGTQIKTWLISIGLRNYLKEKQFGKTLNRIFDELSRYGTVVLKKVGNDLYFVNLKNFVCDPSADSLNESNHIIEPHYYTPSSFQSTVNEHKWNKKAAKNLLEKFTDSDDFIRVYERYGYEIEDGEVKYYLTIVGEVKDSKTESKTLEEAEGDGELLYKAEIKEHPYYEFHINKMPGRWLGVGMIEPLIDTQIRVNEITNQMAKSSQFSSLRLWQTEDTGVSRNILSDSENGDILEVTSPINPINMTDRNMSAYFSEIQEWIRNRDENAFSYDVVRGEQLPGSVTLGAQRIAAGMATSYFDKIRENVAMDVKELLYDFIIPKFNKYLNAGTAIKIFGEDIDKLNQLVIDNRVRQKIIKFIRDKKRLPDPEFVDLVKGIIEKDRAGIVEDNVIIPKDWLKDIKYDIDIVIVGENIDTTTRASTLQVALATITSDPTVLQDPSKRKIFSKFLEAGGVNITDIEAQQSQIQELGQAPVGGAGGGVAAPTPIGVQQQTI